MVAPAQQVFALEAEASLPRGFSLRAEAGVLTLIRDADGASMGIVPSVDFAARHASALVRITGPAET